MGWTAPAVRATGDLITAAIWNTDIKDNLLYLYSGLPTCRVYNNANISLANNTLTALTFNTERWDTDAIHDLVTNPGRLTCKTAGLYHIWGGAELAASANYRHFYLAVRLNGATIIAESGNFDDATIATQTNKIALSTPYQLAVNDYVELLAFQINGGAGALNVLASTNYSPEFAMSRIG